jgi:16S rRNA (guanine527-N7)-methyltransferase
MRPEPTPRSAESAPHLAALPAETRERLERFVWLLRHWQATHNLVSPNTLKAVWTRHVEDSLQLLDHAGEFSTWVDLGSGAGFPGMMVAIASTDAAQRFILIESNKKKAAFLRAAARETKAPVTVVAERAEAQASRMAGAADIVSARALAPLIDLCRLSFPFLHSGSRVLLLKGHDLVHEVEEASKAWAFDLVVSESVTDPSGRVALLRNLSPKDPSA